MPASMRDPVPFPNDFLWGAATASYQIEGGANEGGRGRSVWDTFSHTPGKVANGDTGDVACDHYHRMTEDVGIMGQLGLQAYRFSIAWPRVMPSGRGPINPIGIDFYQRLVDALLDADIVPVPTLFHWDLPQQLEDTGGFANRDTAGRFADYAAAMVQALGDRVKMWSTFNEPWCYAYLGHASGEQAPGHTNDRAAVAAAHHQLLAHGLAVQAARAEFGDLDLGIVINPSTFHSEGSPEVDPAVIDRLDALMNRWWFDALLLGEYPSRLLEAFGTMASAIRPGDNATIAEPIDWIGINYYNDHFVRTASADTDPPTLAFPTVTDIAPGATQPAHTDMGWPITPDGLGSLLQRLHNDYGTLPPLYITENGCAYDDPVEATDDERRVVDTRRVDYLDRHLRSVHAAMTAGVDVRGYFQWSLLDNFEWAFGYDKRFGLVHVDFDTQQRTLKDSAFWYRDVIARGGLAAFETEAQA